MPAGRDRFPCAGSRRMADCGADGNVAFESVLDLRNEICPKDVKFVRYFDRLCRIVRFKIRNYPLSDGGKYSIIRL